MGCTTSEWAYFSSAGNFSSARMDLSQCLPKGHWKNRFTFLGPLQMWASEQFSRSASLLSPSKYSMYGGEITSFGGRQPWVPVPALPLISCATLVT